MNYFKTGIRPFSFLVFMTGMTFFIHAQIVSSAQIKLDSVLIGDTVSVDIKVTIPAGVTIQSLDFSDFSNIENQVYFNDTVFLDKYADIEILNFGNWKHADQGTPVPLNAIQINNSGGKQTITNKITIAIYNSGIFNIPGPKVISQEDIETLPSESDILLVSLPEKLMKQDTVTFNPIKDIMHEEADITDYLIYVYIFLAILVMVAIGYYFFRLKKKKEAETIPVFELPVLPAHERALLALKSLHEKELWQNGLIKEYQSGLTDIIRTYLQDRYGINALEKTTDEITLALSSANFDTEYIHDLKEILQIADLVKFAKATPQENVHGRFMNKAIEFVENTKETETLQ